jgi:hypothetical protein
VDVSESPELHNHIAVALAVLLILGAFLALASKARPNQTRWFALLLFAAPILLLLLPDALFGGIRSISGRYLTPAWLAVICALGHLSGSSALRPALARALYAGLIVAGLASCYVNAGRFVVWTKGVSSRLPQVAAIINERPKPLVVGNFERHHPGNLLALSYLLRPDAEFQFLPAHDGYALPPGKKHVFLYSPIREFRRDLEKNHPVKTRLLTRDLYFELWEVIPLTDAM